METDPDGSWQNMLLALKHTIVLAFSLATIYAIHWQLEGLLGKDGKIFDLIEFRYITATGYIVAFAQYSWSLREAFRRK